MTGPLTRVLLAIALASVSLQAPADSRRFAVQGFVDAARPGGGGGTLAPHDAFALRLDLEPVSIQAIGK